ncbi:MAG: hypothetical protein KF763_15560 [Cyclobacteriaceae bacterium]|nr:hypothetical protein [Cyclobacteriaceae bacterium]
MVNLATGDFVYNLPLLEVPGPAGGYPISMSYHAGIQPNEDASWVGLGWTLNPGSIARTVNGYPDDQLGAIRTRHDYNSGGTRNTFSLGVGVAGFSLNLAVSHDSNLGVGIGTSVGYGYSFGVGGPDSGVNAGISASVGTDPFGGAYAGGDIGITGGGARASVGLDTRNGASGQIGLAVLKGTQIGINTDFKSVSGYAGLQVGLLGVSISSKGLKPSMSVAGIPLGQTSSNAGRMTTKSWGFSTPPIPIGPFTFTLGYNYLRYYSDETSNVSLIGTLKASSTSGKNPDNWAFDSYALLDPDAEGGVIKNNDPEKSKGGSFPAYDSYSVMAQGLGGSIQPYIFENGTLFRQNLKNQPNNGNIIYNRVNNSFNFSEPVNFRFKNDFSNSYTYNQATMRVAPNGSNVVFEGVQPTSTPPEGFNSTNNHLAGSKHIEYFTNQQIRDGIARDKGFIDANPHTSRDVGKFGYNVSEQIGGFMITNESGVTYHYSLPVYSYNQFSKSFQTGKEGDVFQRTSENHPYAYTWFLTAVTGPDYVNRNSANDGTISSQDWGYWTKFDYALHTDNYVWRNPVEGTHRDVNREIETYSYGQKELYYLNSISTTTHVAYFEKSVRVDGRGVTNAIQGGFTPYTQTNCYTDPNCNPDDCTDEDFRICDGYCQICESTQAVAGTTLKLDKIYLLSREDFESGTEFLSKAIRVISLTTDYSLALGTTNSFSDSNINTKHGKLTLKEVKFLGKGGADLIPPTKFVYNKNPSFNKDAYDIWGLYKSDFQPSQLNTQESLGRLTTKSSSQNIDAWSLTTIKSSLGSSINIEYESDSYNTALALHSSLFIKEIIPQSNSNVSIVKFYNTVDFSESAQILIGQEVTLLALLRQYGYSANLFGCAVDGVWQGNIFLWDFFNDKGNVVEVGHDFLKIESQALVDYINKIYGNKCVSCTTAFINGAQSSCAPYVFSNPGTFLGGNILLNNTKIVQYGGGLRVKTISVNSEHLERKTNYYYSGGSTSYEPINLEVPIIEIFGYNSWIEEKQSDAIDSYREEINKQFSSLLSISREIPAPGVIYEKVTIEEEILNRGEQIPTKIPGKKVYEFQTFDEGMVERLGISTTTNTGLYAVECYDTSGNPTYCGPTPPGHPGPHPVFCKDQNGNTVSCSTFGGTTHTPLTLKDFSAWVGALKSITTYGADDIILEKTTNQYLHENKTTTEFVQELRTKFNGQGIVSQVFNENRNQVGYVFSRRDEYPLVAIGQTSIDYKNGITTTSKNLAFDFYTGSPLKVLNTDGYGNKYVIETVPAYTIPEYSGTTSSQIASGFVGMGLKVNNLKNKHMLTQGVSSQTFLVNNNYENTLANADKLALVSASAQTWSDSIPVLGIGLNGIDGLQTGIWRQRASFNFIASDNVSLRADGLYPYSNFNQFNAWIGDEVPDNWKKISEVKLVDIYSHALEAMDMNENFAATKMSFDQTRVFTTVANSRYNEFAFSGLEETPDLNGELGGGVVLGGTVAPTAHTGSSAASTLAGEPGFTYSFTNSTAKKFHVSVWSDKPNSFIKYKIDNGSDQNVEPTVNQAGSWYLHEADIYVGADETLEVWCEANGVTTLFDDFRIHPLKAAMVSYVYNQWGELSHILDANNLYTEYRYDNMGRLKETYRESFQNAFGNNGIVKVGEYSINYASTTAHMLQLNVSKTGPTGTVSPTGQVSVAKGGNQLINLFEYCQNQPVLQDIIIDGRSYGTAATIVTIPSGTILKILRGNVGGEIYTSISLENVQGLHSVQAKFGSPQLGGGQGSYVCETINGCYTGTILYIGVDECGRSLPPQVAAPGSGGLTCTNPPGSNCLEY